MSMLSFSLLLGICAHQSLNQASLMLWHHAMTTQSTNHQQQKDRLVVWFAVDFANEPYRCAGVSAGLLAILLSDIFCKKTQSTAELAFDEEQIGETWWGCGWDMMKRIHYLSFAGCPAFHCCLMLAYCHCSSVESANGHFYRIKILCMPQPHPSPVESDSRQQSVAASI